MLKKILVPTDGSDQAVKAVTIASDLAVRNEADLVIMHVQNDNEPLEPLRRFAEVEHIPKKNARKRVKSIEATPHGPVPIPGGEDTVVDLSAARNEISKRVLAEARTIADERGARMIDCLLLEGKPAEKILHTAHEKGADTIVMGSRGLGNLKSAIFGSVSRKVCEHAGYTCITVN